MPFSRHRRETAYTAPIKGALLLNRHPFLDAKKPGSNIIVIFRQPGYLSETRRLSAPSLRMVKYYRLSL